MIVRTLLFFISVFVGANLVSAQEVEKYRIYDVLPGEKFAIPVESTQYPDILRDARHGSVAKFKYFFETQYRIRYQPSATFSGLDTIVLVSYHEDGSHEEATQLEGLLMRVNSTRAVDDHHVYSGMSPQSLAVTDNDDATNEFWISEIVHVSDGSATIADDQRSLRYVPAQDR
nr:hypothetical protein [Saprospiraceae bacterium]